jgi:uncharacterized GH25 family protein
MIHPAWRRLALVLLCVVSAPAAAAPPAEGGKSASAATGADGTFRFPALREGFWNLPARAPGVVEGSAYRVEVTAGATAEKTISLHRAATLRGVVLGEDGQPLAGAKVEWGRASATTRRGASR